MKRLYVLPGQPDGLFQRLVQAGFGLLHLLFGHGQRSKAYLVKLRFVSQHGTVALGTYPVDDAPYGVKQILGLQCGTLQQFSPLSRFRID